MRYETTIDIQAPVQRVWQVTVDIERWPEWTASMRSVERLDSGPFTVGSRAAIRQPRSPRAVWTVTAMDDGLAFTWESRAPGAHTVATHRLEPLADGGTSVTLTVELSGLVARVLWPLLRGTLQRLVTLEAEGLRRRCETGSVPG